VDGLIALEDVGKLCRIKGIIVGASGTNDIWSRDVLNILDIVLHLFLLYIIFR
jgi:hypothetical protein